MAMIEGSDGRGWGEDEDEDEEGDGDGDELNTYQRLRFHTWAGFCLGRPVRDGWFGFSLTGLALSKSNRLSFNMIGSFSYLRASFCPDSIVRTIFLIRVILIREYSYHTHT